MRTNETFMGRLTKHPGPAWHSPGLPLGGRTRQTLALADHLVFVAQGFVDATELHLAGVAVPLPRVEMPDPPIVRRVGLADEFQHHAARIGAGWTLVQEGHDFFVQRLFADLRGGHVGLPDAGNGRRA